MENDWRSKLNPLEIRGQLQRLIAEDTIYCRAGIENAIAYFNYNFGSLGKDSTKESEPKKCKRCDGKGRVMLSSRGYFAGYDYCPACKGRGY